MIYKVLYIPGGCLGFLPSTVSHWKSCDGKHLFNCVRVFQFWYSNSSRSFLNYTHQIKPTKKGVYEKCRIDLIFKVAISDLLLRQIILSNIQRECPPSLVSRTPSHPKISSHKRGRGFFRCAKIFPTSHFPTSRDLFEP